MMNLDEQIEQIYTSCLAQGSYFIESQGEAVVIDPLREPDPYIERAKASGVKIKYILETHFHADFVSGHVDLAKKTGATIVFGPGAETNFKKHEAKDGEILKVGALSIKVLHTPGHTPESTTYLLFDEAGKEHSIYTGDTLFIGDVGRPDLAQKATGLTQEDLAGWLYDSLRNKIMTLPDDVIVYPAHGAGSSCGKNMSAETFDTLGNQKATNYALRADMTRDEFIDEVTAGLQEPPQYFALNASMNKKGYEAFDEVLSQGLNAFSLEDFKNVSKQSDVLILDVRDKGEFAKSHIPGSLFIGLNGSFAPWVGALIEDINQKIAIVAPIGKEEETVRRFARVGYDNCIGYLEGGFESWLNADEEVDSVKTITVEQFIKGDKNAQVIDVRKPSEYESSHLTKALNLPLDFFLSGNTNELVPSEKYILHCKSGYRATVASSLLKQKGIHNITTIIGQFDDLKESGLPVEGSCPSLQVLT